MRAIFLGLEQLDDRRSLGVLARSAGLALLAYAGLLALSLWAAHLLVGAIVSSGWLLVLLHWAAGLLGTLVVVTLSAWLFLPTVILIATLFLDEIAAAVERRYYPGLPPPDPAALHMQLWDALSLAFQALVLNGVAMLFAILLPGVGILPALAVGGWAIGRGLFVAVAMRRMGRDAARARYRANRLAVLGPGVLLALGTHIPLLNLAVPIVGTAAMVHVLHRTAWRARMPKGLFALEDDVRPAPVRGRPPIRGRS